MEDESASHTIRDCAVAKQVWSCLIPNAIQSEFFSLQCKDWIVWFMRMGLGGWQPARWLEQIMLVCWMQ